MDYQFITIENKTMTFSFMRSTGSENVYYLDRSQDINKTLTSTKVETGTNNGLDMSSTKNKSRK